MAVVTGLLLATPALAQEDHGGGSSGCGDLFGDLVHVLRDPVSGVPILQKRQVEVSGPCDLPEGELCLEWAYCPIALDASGNPLDFLPISCDVDPASGTAVAVDYFGRLSGGRTKERNIRMHFDEVIEKIGAAEAVWREATGRIALGTGCTLVAADGATCATWTEIDSPLENMAVYVRLMKYGHLQTDPAEVDIWAHGDPALPTQLHPALSAADHAKFVGEARALLPAAAGCPASADPACFAPEALSGGDLLIASSLLAGAADKTGQATVDLVQYLNRILKIPVATPTTAAPVEVRYAKFRDCGAAPDAQPGTPGCAVVEADASYPAPANERFVSFGAVTYDRVARFTDSVEVLRPVQTLGLPRLVALEALLRTEVEDVWVVEGVPLLDWLTVRNGAAGATGTDVDGFVKATNDAMRAVEFVHNYSVPEDLGWDFVAPAAP